jgi:hypothetical protein
MTYNSLILNIGSLFFSFGILSSFPVSTDRTRDILPPILVMRTCSGSKSSTFNTPLDHQNFVTIFSPNTCVHAIDSFPIAYRILKTACDLKFEVGTVNLI